MKAHHYFIVGLSLVLLMLLFALSDESISNDIRNQLHNIPNVDTIGHIISFSLITWLIHGIMRVPLMNSILCITFYAALTEVGQYYLGFRSADFSDFIADMVGIMLFITLKVIYTKALSVTRKKLDPHS